MARKFERGPQGDHGQQGPVGPTGPQGEPGRNAPRILSGATLRLIAFIIVAAAAIYSTARTYDISNDNRHAIEQINRERAERIDQSCRGDETEHLNEVVKLKRAYDYLTSLPDKPFGELSDINQAIVRNIPNDEADAKTDSAPEYCDITLPHGVAVGLPEPDPVVPERPEQVERWLEEAGLAQDKRLDNKAVNGDVRGK